MTEKVCCRICGMNQHFPSKEESSNDYVSFLCGTYIDKTKKGTTKEIQSPACSKMESLMFRNEILSEKINVLQHDLNVVVDAYVRASRFQENNNGDLQISGREAQDQEADCAEYCSVSV